MISLFKPNMNFEEIEALSSVIYSKWLGLGPKVKEFETKFGNYVGRDYPIGLNSGTSALHLALILSGVKEKDEVIVPAITFVSTAHVVKYCGATPVFCDVIPGPVPNLNLNSVPSLLTDKTKAIIPVHYGGHLIEISFLRNLLPKEVKIIEDCAHASGTKKAGLIGDFSCFSFQAIKNLSCGDGGMLFCSNQESYERAKQLRWLGIDKGTWERGKNNNQYLWEYDVKEIGYKYHMNDIQAALGIIQLKKLEKANKYRSYLASRYIEELKDISEIVLPPFSENCSWHIFSVLAQERDSLLNFLSSNGISCGVHYKPLPLHSCYKSSGSFPVAEKSFRSLLSLPMGPHITVQDFQKVCSSIGRFYGYNL